MLKPFFVHCICLCFSLMGSQAFALEGNEVVSKSSSPHLSEMDITIIYISLVLAVPVLLLFWGKVYFKVSKAIKSLPAIELSTKNPLNLQTLSETEKKEIFSKHKPPVSDIEKALAQEDRKKFIRHMVGSVLFTAFYCGILFFMGCVFLNHLFVNLFVHFFITPMDFSPMDFVYYIILILSFCFGALILLSVVMEEDLYMLKTNPYFLYQKLLKIK